MAKQANMPIVDISTKTYSLHYKNALKAAQHFKSIGAQTTPRMPENSHPLTDFLRQYQKPCILDYHIGFVLIKNPS